jgi:hypothetical protein
LGVMSITHDFSGDPGYPLVSGHYPPNGSALF